VQLRLIRQRPRARCVVKDHRLLGRHVESLNFIELMLGDKPPLSPVESFYQRILASDPDEVAFAKRVLEAIPDGRGVHMLDGKMQDDATWKQAQVMVSLARMLADKDAELRAAYGF